MTSPNAPIRVELPSSARLLPIVRSTLFALAAADSRVRLARDELDEVSVTLQEACTNVVRHAHGLDASKPLRVEFHVRPDALEIHVIDRGPPFDIAGTQTPDPEALQEGGYGISIMRAWMDHVAVDREIDGNRLRLVRLFRTTVECGPEDSHVGAR